MQRRLFIVQFGPAGKTTRAVFILANCAAHAAAFGDRQKQDGEKVVVTEVVEPVHETYDEWSDTRIYPGLDAEPAQPRLAD